jgi:hypothetical protein
VLTRRQLSKDAELLVLIPQAERAWAVIADLEVNRLLDSGDLPSVAALRESCSARISSVTPTRATPAGSTTCPSAT